MKAHVRSGVITLCLFSGSILFGFGCRSSAMSYESIASCSERGGSVERVCVVQDANDFSQCKQYRDACMGATISLDGWEAQRQQEMEDILHPGQGSTPFVVPTEEENLNAWISRLNTLDKNIFKRYEKDARKSGSKTAWLNGLWCSKDSEQDLPQHYYLSISGFDYSDMWGKGNSSFESYIEIVGNYYDLWSWVDTIGRNRFYLVRLEKQSDREYSVVYKLDKVSYGLKIDFVKKESAEINPAEHIQNPEVFTKCDYKPRR